VAQKVRERAPVCGCSACTDFGPTVRGAATRGDSSMVEAVFLAAVIGWAVVMLASEIRDHEAM
jgi:Zn-dependent alcohol dehydrogenase